MLDDAAHERRRQLVGLDDLQLQRVDGRDVLRLGLVQQVQGALAGVGAPVGAFTVDVRLTHACDVVAGAGVDPDAVALLDEQRHLDRLAGLQHGRLAGAGHAVALHARARSG